MGDFTLFQRSNSANWWMRFTVPGEGQIRKSLGTSDEAEAGRLAHREYSRAMIRNESGLRSRQQSFEQVATEFIAHRHRQCEMGEKRADKGKRDEALVRRFFIPFFGGKPIDAITDRDVLTYQDWRKTYWTHGPGRDLTSYPVENSNSRAKTYRVTSRMRRTPSVGTQRTENIVLNDLFRWAARMGYIPKGLQPEVGTPAVPPAPRPSFNSEEMAKLSKLARERMEDGKVNDEVRRDRTILYAYLLVAVNSGMRPTELKNLLWGDVLHYQRTLKLPLGERDIRLRARGKGKAREFVPHEGALGGFDLLWMLWLRDHESNPPEDTDPVFARKSGVGLTKINKSLNALLEAAKLKTDHRGKNRDSYSFRHYHISQQLIAGVDVFVLARNTGTSPQMIDKHYGQVTNEQFADRLRPEWR